MNRATRILMALRTGRSVANTLLCSPGATIKRATRSISGYESWNVIAIDVPYRVLQSTLGRAAGELNMGGSTVSHPIIVPWDTPVQLNDMIEAGGRSYRVMGERSNPAYRVQRVLVCDLYQEWDVELP